MASPATPGQAGHVASGTDAQTIEWCQSCTRRTDHHRHHDRLESYTVCLRCGYAARIPSRKGVRG